MKINRLPAPTWNRLKVNETEVNALRPTKAAGYEEQLPEGVDKIHRRGIGPLSDVTIKTGLGEEFDRFIDDAGFKADGYVVPDEAKINIPVYQDFDVKRNDASVASFDYTLGDNAELTVIQNIKDSDAESGVFFLQNKYRLSKGAKLKIVQIQTLSENKEFYNDLGGHVSDDATFELVQIVLGGKNNYYGANTHLAGKNSALNLAIAYSLENDELLDMNYVADHDGKNSVSDIKAGGVMQGRAEKVFRGTIDFHKGCAGSKGAEIEDVLLIDDTIVNKTVPLILCDEEDVEGAHGATIGRPDETLMFYMRSRGISEDEAYKLLKRAKIDAVANLIEDEKTRTYVEEYLDRE